MNVQIDLNDVQLQELADRVAALLPAAQGVDGWLTVTEAADHLRCPKSRVYSLTAAGRIPHVKDGSRNLYRRSQLDLWLHEGGGIRP